MDPVFVLPSPLPKVFHAQIETGATEILIIPAQNMILQSILIREMTEMNEHLALEMVEVHRREEKGKMNGKEIETEAGVRQGRAVGVKDGENQGVVAEAEAWSRLTKGQLKRLNLVLLGRLDHYLEEAQIHPCRPLRILW